MQLAIYTIFDAAVQEYQTPFFAINPMVAVRNFRIAALDEKTVLGQAPSDFSLYEIGTWHPDEGVIKEYAPIFVINGSDLLNQEGEAYSDIEKVARYRPGGDLHGNQKVGDESPVQPGTGGDDPAQHVRQVKRA